MKKFTKRRVDAYATAFVYWRRLKLGGRFRNITISKLLQN